MEGLDENDVIVVIVTSLAVCPVANIPFIGIHKKVPIIEINLDRYIPDEVMLKPNDDLTEANVQIYLYKTNVTFLQGSSGHVLPPIVDGL